MYYYICCHQKHPNGIGFLYECLSWNPHGLKCQHYIYEIKLLNSPFPNNLKYSDNLKFIMVWGIGFNSLSPHCLSFKIIIIINK